MSGLTADMRADALAEALRTVYPDIEGLDGVTDEALGRLSPFRQRVLKTRYLSVRGRALTHEEVAAALNAATDTVRSVDYRALRALGVVRRTGFSAPKLRLRQRRLASEEVPGLVEAHKAGDREAAQALVEGHAGFIASYALRFRGRGLDDDDLRQEGALAFLHAARKYDPVRSGIMTYAQYHVRARVGRATIEQGAIVYLPHHIMNALRSARRRGKLTREELAAAIMQEGFITERTAQRAVLFATGLRSADTTVDEDGQPVVEATADEDAPAPGDRLDAEEIARLVREKLLFDLDARERRIVAARLMCDPEDEVSREDLGRELDISRERVRQIEEKLKERLKKRWALMEVEEELLPAKRARESTQPAPQKCRTTSRSASSEKGLRR